MKVEIFSGKFLSGNFRALRFAAKDDCGPEGTGIVVGIMGEVNMKDEVRALVSMVA